ncbi:Class I glutamine amidotransferase-like protein [Naviculisporaceae sp. PSN 640]
MTSSTTAPSGSPKALRIAVMLEAIQFSDIIGIDIFANLSRSYMAMAEQISPRAAALSHHAIPMEFYYLATTLLPAEFVVPGNNFRYLPTHTYDTCPRDLDILLIGGPLLTHRPPSADKFMKEAWGRTKVILTTCTGSLWLASTGLLEGKRVTTNREFLGAARGLYPGIKWEERRWVVEEKPYNGGDGKGELWTSGAAGHGLEMIAAYCLEKFDNDFVRFLGLEGLNLHNMSFDDQSYPEAVEGTKQEAKAAAPSSFLSRILRGGLSWK